MDVLTYILPPETVSIISILIAQFLSYAISYQKATKYHSDKPAIKITPNFMTIRDQKIDIFLINIA